MKKLPPEASRSYLISQEAQLRKEVLGKFEFVSDGAFLDLGPHGLGLHTYGFLKPQVTITNTRTSGETKHLEVVPNSIPLLTDTASASLCPVWFFQTGSGLCLLVSETGWNRCFCQHLHAFTDMSA